MAMKRFSVQQIILKISRPNCYSLKEKQFGKCAAHVRSVSRPIIADIGNLKNNQDNHLIQLIGIQTPSPGHVCGSVFTNSRCQTNIGTGSNNGGRSANIGSTQWYAKLNLRTRLYTNKAVPSSFSNLPVLASKPEIGPKKGKSSDRM